jgi:hypothetical protein
MNKRKYKLSHLPNAKETEINGKAQQVRESTHAQLLD